MAASDPVYLVLEPDMVVAADLSDAIAADDPGAEVHVASGIEAAGAALDGLPPVEAAILNASIADLRSSGLADRVEAAGGAVVVLSGAEAEADKAATGWQFVQRPFGAESVTVALMIARAGTGPSRRSA
jgi:hypothetical protein